MFDAQEWPLLTKSAFKTYISGLRFTSSAETEKKLALERPPVSRNTASNIIHSTIADQHSSRVATTFTAHCAVHCTVEEFNVKFCESRLKISTIPYRAMCMTSRARVQCPGTATGAAVQCTGDIVNFVYLCDTKITRTAVLLGEIMVSHKPEWHLPIWSILSVPALGAISYYGSNTALWYGRSVVLSLCAGYCILAIEF